MRVPFTRNVGAKVGALLLAAVVWLHVATEKTYETHMVIPVAFVGLDEGYAIEGAVPDSADVVVRADGKTLFRVGERGGLVLRVDLSGARSGDTTVVFRPGMVAVPLGEGIDVVEVTAPKRAELGVARRAVREFTVVPRVTVTPKPGYVQTGPAVAVPDRVSVSGAYTALPGIAEVPTAEVVFSDAMADIRRAVPVPPPAEGLSVEPEYVTVAVEIEPAAERDFEVPVELRGAPEGATVQPPVVFLTLAGGENKLADLTSSDLIVYIDYERVGENGEATASIETPRYTRWVRATPQVFRVIP
jgi:YbbR domain-containing protein